MSSSVSTNKETIRKWEMMRIEWCDIWSTSCRRRKNYAKDKEDEGKPNLCTVAKWESRLNKENIEEWLLFSEHCRTDCIFVGDVIVRGRRESFKEDDITFMWLSEMIDENFHLKCLIGARRTISIRRTAVDSPRSSSLRRRRGSYLRERNP